MSYKDKEKEAEHARKYYLANKEKRKAYQKARYLEKKEEILQKNSVYQKAHRKEYAESKRKYRLTPKGKESVLKSIRKYELNNPNRKKAWDKVKFFPKQPCQVCGEINVHKHHPDIMKPLEIIFLCPLHHKQAHL